MRRNAEQSDEATVDGDDVRRRVTEDQALGHVVERRLQLRARARRGFFCDPQCADQLAAEAPDGRSDHQQQDHANGRPALILFAAAIGEMKDPPPCGDRRLN